MPRTTVDRIKETYGPTDLDNDVIRQAMKDANNELNRRWKTPIESAVPASASDPSRVEVLESVERLLACHFMKDIEPDITSDGAEGLSTSFALPTGALDEWLSNTTHGRRLESKLASLGITVSETGRSLPGVYN